MTRLPADCGNSEALIGANWYLSEREVDGGSLGIYSETGSAKTYQGHHLTNWSIDVDQAVLRSLNMRPFGRIQQGRRHLISKPSVMLLSLNAPFFHSSRSGSTAFPCQVSGSD
jgi:hypothetical protein